MYVHVYKYLVSCFSSLDNQRTKQDLRQPTFFFFKRKNELPSGGNQIHDLLSFVGPDSADS